MVPALASIASPTALLDAPFARAERRAAPDWSARRARLSDAAGRFATHLAGVDLAVDLGHRIGSRSWWRGFATLGALAGAAASIAINAPTLIGAVPYSEPASVREERAADSFAPLARGGTTGRNVAPNANVRRLSEVPERPRIELVARVGAGGLESALRRSGVGRDDLDAVRRLLSGVASPSSLSPGTELALVLGRRENRSQPRPLDALAFRAAFDLKLELARDANGALLLKRIPIKVDETPLRISGEIGSSLVRAARAAGLPSAAISDYMKQMGFVVDFQREARGKDRFDIIIEHRRAETGETQQGRLLYAGLRNGKQDIRLMRWGPRGEFYRDNGEGARKGLMRTPVDGARLTSGFGMRFHPILNYSRMHQGVDFAAGTGTPVLASANGRVVKAGWGGGYGNVVHIDHGRGIITRYAHLSRIGVRVGQQVSQGQSVGAVGTTGLSTGPHLHYEVWINGRAADPRQAKFQSQNRLGGSDLRRFKGQMQKLQSIRATA